MELPSGSPFLLLRMADCLNERLQALLGSLCEQGTLAPVLMWLMSVATPSVPTMSYRLSSLTSGCLWVGQHQKQELTGLK